MLQNLGNRRIHFEWHQVKEGEVEKWRLFRHADFNVSSYWEIISLQHSSTITLYVPKFPWGNDCGCCQCIVCLPVFSQGKLVLSRWSCPDDVQQHMQIVFLWWISLFAEKNYAASLKPVLLNYKWSQPWIVESFHNIPGNGGFTLVCFQRESDERLHIKHMDVAQ